MGRRDRRSLAVTFAVAIVLVLAAAVIAGEVQAAIKLVEAGLSPTEAASQLGLGRSRVYREVAAARVVRKAS